MVIIDANPYIPSFDLLPRLKGSAAQQFREMNGHQS